MYDKQNQQSFINTENRTLTWFLALFYIIYFFYEIFYQGFYRDFLSYGEAESPGILNYVMYALILGLLPITYMLINRGRIFVVKYFFVASYFIISFIGESAIFVASTESFRSGNAAEVLLLLLAPIFVNTHFFLFVSIGLLLKYLVIGLLFGVTEVVFAIAFSIILSFISLFILNRFQVYVGAIQTAHSNQLEGIVKGVIATIELKDPYTRGHSERVANYAKTLATSLNRYTKNELTSFYYACLLHDIGKVSIPDSILMKPGRLTAEEYEVIKTHPDVGTEAIRKVDGINMSIEVIKYHHERWDGTGYPERLKGKDIPLMARIVTIADAFDAMTSSRSYRSALSVEDAYNRIVEGKGSQFDPELVEAFQKIFPEWVNYHQAYNWFNADPFQNKAEDKEVAK